MNIKFFNKKTLYILLTLIISILVGLIGGIIDIVQPKSLVITANTLSYPLYFFTLLGVFKVLGALALFFPSDKIKNIAYTGFTFDFIFASFSHFSVNDSILKIVTPLILLMILFVSYKLKEVKE